MTVKDSIRFYAATDIGKVRTHNEDNFLVDKKLSLFLVADGMGGHAAGEVASAIAVRTVHDEIRREKARLDTYVASGASDPGRATTRDVVALLEHSVQSACSKIHEAARLDPSKRGMGTTLSVLLVLGHRGFIAHVGDSRVYLSRAGRTRQVTEDHTVCNELIKRGKLTRAQIEKVQQKNAITRAVGIYERVEVDTLVIELIAGDTLVLASDGLHGYLQSPDELDGPLSLEGDASVKSLVDLANSRGGRDNITTIVVRLGADGAADGARAQRLALEHDVLANMPLFARLTERELLRVMQAAQVREFEDGDVVIREGDKGDELYIVLDGHVRVSRGEQTLSLLGPGEHVGEMALIRSVPRSATVAAVGRAELISIRRADFFEILRKEHEVAVKMLWQFLGVLADRLDQTNTALHEMKREPAVDDIASEIFPEVKTGQYPPVSPGIAR
jgi:serine/threonine protein phosphatase PrpC/CRP-like cAMP-binding protein